MNGKKAKLIRKIAQSRTVGWDDTAYMMQTNENIHEYRCIRLRPECTRHVYQQDKKEYLKSMRA